MLSLPFIHECFIPWWMNRVYRCTWREWAPELTLCSTAHRLRCRRRGGSIFGIKPSLPLFYSPPSAFPFSVALSLFLFHFIFLLLMLSSHPFPLHQMNKSEFLFLAASINCLIPAGVCKKEKRERDRQTWLKDIYECIYVGLRESQLWAPAPILLWNKPLLVCTRKGLTVYMGTKEWEAKICRRSIILSVV